AVINLISNSLKFTPKKGLISVGAQIVRNGELPEAIVITVTDSGMGIKAEDLEKIWSKYKQTKNKSLRGGGGTGLGLYIVKQIIGARHRNPIPLDRQKSRPLSAERSARTQRAHHVRNRLHGDIAMCGDVFRRLRYR